MFESSRARFILISTVLLATFTVTRQASAAKKDIPADCIREAVLTHTQYGVADLLRRYRTKIADGNYKIKSPEKLVFTGTAGRDVYNSTTVFQTHFQSRPVDVLLGRTEEPHLETGTESIFYVRNGPEWKALAGAPKFSLQDPFFASIDGELVVGGVKVFEKPEGGLGYRTVFYRDGGRGIEHLTPFASGPDGMKDVRLVSLKDGTILVLTRPQGEIGGRGKIGVTIVRHLEDLTAERIKAAPLLEGQFEASEWGGANAAYLLADGNVGILGHIARFDEAGNRDYYPVAFIYNPKTKTATPLSILVERGDLPLGLEGKSKRKDLKNVLFSGGLIRHSDGTATLYVGAGDAETYQLTIPDPFI